MLGQIAVSVHKKAAMTWNPVGEPAFDIQSSEQVCRSWLTALYELSCDRLPTSPGWSPRACFFVHAYALRKLRYGCAVSGSVGFNPVVSSMDFFKAGKLRPLAVTSTPTFQARAV